ncbi:hypothetical protein BURKHO8Y_220121 [Burkholderia sp. 8Y]|nr:hypothetical protein BURKHO8Y_220121 [Burkholderia sp. 8Y]
MRVLWPRWQKSRAKLHNVTLEPQLLS